MSNRFWPGLVAGAVFALAVIATGGYLFIVNGMMPANADARPGKMETWAAKTSLNASIRREAPQGPVPIPLTDAHLINGVKLYAQNCAVCHGAASGTPTNIAKGFYQKAPQLGRHGVEDDPEGETYWKITHGIRLTAMPAFSKTLTDEQRWELTLLLKHMDALPAAPQKAWQTVKSS